MSIAKQILPDSLQRRISFCGAPLPTMIRRSGEQLDSSPRYHCTSKYCGSCRLHYQQRVYACIDSTLDGAKPYLTTLTLRLPSRLSAEQLRRNIDAVKEVQRETHDTLRKHDYAHTRLNHWRRRGNFKKVQRWRGECRARLPSLAQIAQADGLDVRASTLEKFQTSFDEDGLGWQSAEYGKTTYIWAVEITTGANDDRWHVHLHYMVPSRADAERLNAAWQMNRAQRPFAQTDISAPTGGYHSAGARKAPSCEADAAAYLTAYVSKDALDDIPDNRLTAYYYGSKSLRRYDAAGRWRPIGVSRRTESEDPVELVMYDDGVVEPIQRVFKGTSDEWARYVVNWQLESGERAPLDVERAAIMSVEFSEVSEARRDGRMPGAYLAQYRTSLENLPDNRHEGLVDDLLESLFSTAWQSPP